MKILLQQPGTGLFWCADSTWTDDEGKALTFESSLAALDYCVQHQIRDAEIALRFEDRRFDVQLRPFGPAHLQSSGASEGSPTPPSEDKAPREQRHSLAAEIDRILVEGKERRKKRRSGRKPNGNA